MGKYHKNNLVVIYKAHNGGNQWFVVNNDRSISPTHSPNMVWGRNAKNELVLVEWQSEMRLQFNDLRQSIIPKATFKLKPSSHPGKGICKNGKSNQYGHGMDQYLYICSDEFAMKCFMDESGQLHDAEHPF